MYWCKEGECVTNYSSDVCCMFCKLYTTCSDSCDGIKSIEDVESCKNSILIKKNTEVKIH